MLSDPGGVLVVFGLGMLAGIAIFIMGIMFYKQEMKT